MLAAKWFGGYTDGMFPLDWTGSVDILHQYFTTKQPVKYGQCWVFAGVVTTGEVTSTDLKYSWNKQIPYLFFTFRHWFDFFIEK